MYLLFLFVLFILPVFPSGQFKNNQKIRITGLVRLVGAEPFTKITVRYDKIDFVIPDNFKKKLIPYLNRLVSLEGVLRIVILKSADGKYEVKEYHLEKVKLTKK